MLFQVGRSQPSTITELRTGCTVPACPGPPRVTGTTKSTVTLAWKAPEETGGSQVLDYEAEVQPKGRAAMDGGMADEWMLVYQVGLMSPLHHPHALLCNDGASALLLQWSCQRTECVKYPRKHSALTWKVLPGLLDAVSWLAQPADACTAQGDRAMCTIQCLRAGVHIQGARAGAQCLRLQLLLGAPRTPRRPRTGPWPRSHLCRPRAVPAASLWPGRLLSTMAALPSPPTAWSCAEVISYA